MAMRTIRIRTTAPATPPSTGPTMDWVVAGDIVVVVVVGGDVEPVVGEVCESEVGGTVVGPVVVGGAVVGGAVVGGTLGLGVGVMLTCDVVKGSMGVLPLPLAIIEVVIGRLVVVVRLGMVVGLGEAEMRMIVELVFDCPGQERRENMRVTVFGRIEYIDTASVENSCKFVCVHLNFPEVHEYLSVI